MCTLFLSAGKTNRISDGLRHMWYDRFLLPIAHAAEQQGRGAAGILIAQNGAVMSSKEAYPAGIFMARQPWTNLPSMAPSILALHARSGGGYPKTEEYNVNHHPFTGENISLMHEGWIAEDWFQRAASLDIPLETTTDSELVMKVIDRHPTLIEGVRDLFRLFPDSVFGLVIWDKRNPRAINFVSNGRRCSPYHIFRSSLFRTVNVISRFAMVEIALTRIERSEMGLEEVEQSKPYILYTFDHTGKITTQDV